jgi:GntR family transcriptional regulator
MVIQINPHSGVPVYRQLSDQIRFQITAGLIPAGEPIESVRNLAASVGVNSMTVSKAYALLEREGVLEHRRGQQLVVAEANASEKRHAEEAHIREVIVPAVRMVRQFRMSDKKALAIFRDALAANTQETPHEMHH